jgi:predicted signal transduction protein with EAL and GGDEF domain
MERVRSAVQEMKSLQVGEQIIPLQVTLSVGMASFPIDARTDTELLRKADQALYRSKQMGRNQVRLAYEERMLPKTSHYTQTQLERLSRLAEHKGVGEAVLLREALDNLLLKYTVTRFDE